MINNRQQNGRRRGRGGQQPRNGQSNPHSNNRIDNRQRGNAAQLLEKYKTLARDAQMAGDRVNTEYYLQFADHYFRVLSENRARFEEQQGQQQRGRTRDDYGQDEEGEDDGNPFTRPYTPREATNEEGWDEEEGDQQAASQSAPQAQPPRERREFQPRERRPVQAERDGSGERNGGERPRRDEGEREGGERADRGGYRNGGERGSPRRAYGERPAPNNARFRTEAAEAEAQADPDRAEDTPSRIEIALPPALTATPAPTGVEAAPELPMDAPVEVSADEAPAPKRRRTRKPKTDVAPAEA